MERFRDELGDWRLVVHSPYGTPVHAPWALAINARLRERYAARLAETAEELARLADAGADEEIVNVVHRLHEGELAKALGIQLGFNANDGD